MEEASQYPKTRLRRLRYNPGIRKLIRQVKVAPHQLILPLFVKEGKDLRKPIASMPSQFQLSPDQIAVEAKEAQALGLGGIILFGIPETKDATGSVSWSENGVVQKAIRQAKEVAPDIVITTDVCLCEYTDHGHCGPLCQTAGRTDVDNDATLELITRQAISHAKAGADMIAPSGMMDGMVSAIRSGLDAEGFSHLPIMSYAAKYASGFYGPFRDAAESSPQAGDRNSYQMDSASDPSQALREVALDLQEGADMIMVKPALAYLDIIQRVKQQFPGVPLAAYNVSGEYSMAKAAAANGWLDEQRIATEMLTSISRAGADIILTYWAKDFAKWLS